MIAAKASAEFQGSCYNSLSDLLLEIYQIYEWSCYRVVCLTEEATVDGMRLYFEYCYFYHIGYDVEMDTPESTGGYAKNTYLGRRIRICLPHVYLVTRKTSTYVMCVI